MTTTASAAQTPLTTACKRSSTGHLLPLPLFKIEYENSQINLEHARLGRVGGDENRIEDQRKTKGLEPIQECHYRGDRTTRFELHRSELPGGGAGRGFANGTDQDATPAR